MKKVLLAIVVLCCSAFAQVGCEFRNVGTDSGIASLNAQPSLGFSVGGGGVGAAGFRLRSSCRLTNIDVHVWNVDSSSSAAPNTYDLGLYCVSGDCALPGTTNANKLYAHIGPIYGRWFTNNRATSVTYTGVTVTADGVGTSTLSGTTFNLPDAPVGVKVTISSCTGLTGTGFVKASPAPSTSSIAVSKANAASTQTGCTVVFNGGYPTDFQTTTVCGNASFADGCMEGFRIITDGRTVCAVVPCTLPSGVYAAAWGTNCASATATNCAQLMGDEDQGAIYLFTATCASGCSTNYDASGLPATMTFTIGPTTQVWDTTPGSSAPIKAPQILFY